MKEQGLFHTPDSPEPVYSDTLALDLGTVEPSLAGPRRPQDRVPLGRRQAIPRGAAESDEEQLADRAPDALWAVGRAKGAAPPSRRRRGGRTWISRSTAMPASLRHGSVVIAAITSCTNTSNPVGHDRRGTARQEGRGARPEEPALGEDEPGAGIEGRHRLSRQGRAHAVPRAAAVPPGRATAAPRASATRVRCPRPCRRLSPRASWSSCAGAVGQSQLRRADSAGSTRQLSGVARRSSSRTRWPGGSTSTSISSRSARAKTASPSSCGTSGPAHEEIDDAVRAQREGRRCSARRTARLRRRRAVARACRCRRVTVSPGSRTPPTSGARRTSTACRRSRGPITRHRGRARVVPAGRLDHHRPHLTGGFDPEDQPRGPVSRRAWACSRSTSTRTARAAATTK